MDINAEHPMDEVYLDNGATTRVEPAVAEAMVHAMTVAYGNPSSAHRLGVEAARAIAAARGRVARAIGADPSEIVFTSGGTEANALGFRGAAEAARSRHVVVSALEHPSVAAAALALAARGWEVSTVAPTRAGLVEAEALAEAVRPDSAAVALIWVQNELGTVQPIARAVRAVKARAPRCHVHVDAVQAVGKLAVDVSELGCDSLSLSAHKIHGPKGAGALWLKKGARVAPLVHGGGQERDLRPGTEGVPGIVGLGVAVELAERARPEAAARMAQLRDALWTRLLARLPAAMRHGDPAASAPHILSVGFPGLPAEPLLHALEARGVYVSAGSACHARDKKPSATLRAIGVPDDVATLRFSLSRHTSDEEIARAVAATEAAVAELST
jgi:cysteine desulfurase